MEGLPKWEICSMPGLPPRQHEHKRRYTPFTHAFILTRRIWEDDYDGQMILGEPWSLKLPDICLTGEERPHPGNLSQLEIEPGHTAWQVHMLPPAPQRTKISAFYYNSSWENMSTILTLWAKWLKRQGAWLRAGRPGCRRGGDFSSLLRVQTGPGVHSASYKMSTGDFPGGKGGRA